MVLILVTTATFLSTLLGGWFALRIRDRLHLVLGFSAGAMIAVAFFDLLPEAITLVRPRHEATLVTSVAALGFMLYRILDLPSGAVVVWVLAFTAVVGTAFRPAHRPPRR